MEINEYLSRLNAGESLEAGSEMHLLMCELSNRAMRITTQLNNTYRTPQEIRSLFAELTDKPADETFNMFPPFYTDCGLNITVGRDVFINACCNFQDQGGIRIGDSSLIGHKVVLATGRSTTAGGFTPVILSSLLHEGSISIEISISRICFIEVQFLNKPVPH